MKEYVFSTKTIQDVDIIVRAETLDEAITKASKNEFCGIIPKSRPLLQTDLIRFSEEKEIPRYYYFSIERKDIVPISILANSKEEAEKKIKEMDESDLDLCVETDGISKYDKSSLVYSSCDSE